MNRTNEPYHFRIHILLSRKSWSRICWPILLINVLLLVGCATPPSPKAKIVSRPFELENGYATLSDAPRCSFKWIYWSFANSRNPLLLTRDTLDNSMIGIMRIPTGKTLPTGKIPVRSTMTLTDMEALLKENLQNRPNSSVDYGSITATKTKVAGHDAILMDYRTTTTPAHQGLECVFQSGEWLFYFAFSTVDDFRYEEDSRNFETVLATFRVLH